jgi:hypothetical protein
MNEVYYRGTGGQDYVELFNPQGGSVVLERFALSDGAGFIDSLQVGLALPPGAVTVLNDSTPGDPFVRDLVASQIYLYRFTENNLLQLVDKLGWGPGVGDPPPPTPAPPLEAVVRTPDGNALYLGDQGANWLDCGGGVSLFYGLKTPGQPNVPPNALRLVVDQSGGGDYLTISAAVQAAPAGAIVEVKPGTYEEAVTLRNSVSIVGLGEEAGDVVITGEGGNTVLKAFGVGSETRVSRLTIRGGRRSGLRVVNGSPVFRNVLFEFNVAEQNGGAAAIEGGSPVFDGCLFQNNHAQSAGGAVWVLSGSPTFESCVFVGNESQGPGGAIYVQAGLTRVSRGVMDRNASRSSSTGIVHASGGVAVVEYTLVTNSEDGSPLWAQGTGQVDFGCGVLWNNPDALGQGDVDTTAVVVADPGYCQPYALNYGYGSASPVMGLQAIISPVTLENVCPGVVGIVGPPCGQTLTDAREETVPRPTRLLQPVPNPFNATTLLRYELGHGGRVELRIFDVRGRWVADLVPGAEQAAGLHEVVWHGQDGHGTPVASGIYLARLRLDGEGMGPTRRLVLLK